MGLLVLIAVGGFLGWLASILGRSDEPRGIGLSVALGVAAALVGGALASDSSLLIGLSAQALLLAVAGALAVLAGFYLARRTRPQKDTI